jgi:hypothetical protein
VRQNAAALRATPCGALCIVGRMGNRQLWLVIITISFALPSSESRADRQKDLRDYVLKAVDQINSEWGNKGYDSAYFTHDLDYAQPGQIKAHRKHPKTMCVAAVAEIIIVALKAYVDETHDESVFKRLPARSWNRGSKNDIRAYIWMYDTVNSNGTADAIQQFGIGEQISFRDLLPGDFVNLNREKTGHAVVFLGYLNKAGEIEAKYDEAKVVGFKYFSAQGRDNGGLGYRWGYFEGFCPDKNPVRPRDCHIKRSRNQRILNTGYLWHPTLWKTEEAAKDRLDQEVRRLVERRFPTSPRKIGQLSTQQLDMFKVTASSSLEQDNPKGIPPPTYNGETVDD